MRKKLLAILIAFTMLFTLTGCTPIQDVTNGSEGGSEGPAGSYDSTGSSPPTVEEVVNLDFFVANDMHGNVTDDNNIGIAKTSTYLKAQSAESNCVFLASGDMWQGSSESNNTKGAIVTDWMNILGFSSMTLGNHEFDWGDEYISDNSELADFPFLAINIYQKDTNDLAEFCQPSVLVEKAGVTVGIIGAMGDCYSSIVQSMVEDYRFAVSDELTGLVKAEATRLREAGADIIVYSLHDGLGSSYSTSYERTLDDNYFEGYYDVSLSDGYVDIVFEGHSHQSYIVKDSYGVYHVQGGSSNKYLAHVDMNYNTVTDQIITIDCELTATSLFSNFQDDAETAYLFEKYADQIGNVYEVLGTNATRRSSDELREVCSELYLKAGLEKWGNSYDIVLGGGYLSCRNPYTLDAGDVCYKDLQSLFPFDNAVVLASISGKNLKDKFINTNNANYFITLSEYGKSILNSISDNKTYYVITDTYSSEYAPNKMTTVDYLASPDLYARDLLAQYIKAGGFATK